LSPPQHHPLPPTLVFVEGRDLSGSPHSFFLAGKPGPSYPVSPISGTRGVVFKKVSLGALNQAFWGSSGGSGFDVGTPGEWSTRGTPPLVLNPL